MRSSIERILIGYLAFAAAGTASTLLRTHVSAGRGESLLFFFTALTCFCIAAPWLAEMASPRAGSTASPRSARRALSIGAVCLSMLLLLVRSIAGGAATLVQAIAAAPVLILPGMLLIVVAEEVFFRDALPATLWAPAGESAAGNKAGRVVAALVSQSMYAAAHLPATLAVVGIASIASVGAFLALATKLIFGLLLLLMAWEGKSLVERVLIHSAVNVAVLIAPPSGPWASWRGPLFATLGLLAFVAIHRATASRGLRASTA